MSIASELTALAANRDAIKAAIEAKGVADAGDTLSEFPAAIASIPTGGSGNELEPYPWVGSGTHVWLHFDADSPSHTFRIESFYYPPGTTTIKWGDGSADATFTNSDSSNILFNAGISHEYANGDYRLDITGTSPISFYVYGGFIGGRERAHYRPDSSAPIVQFETDVDMIVGNGSPTYSIIGVTMNCRWMKFTEATEISTVGIYDQLGLIGMWAPKCKKFFRLGCYMPQLRTLELPSIQTFFDANGQNAGDWCNGRCPSLRSFAVPEGVATLPNNFMNNAKSLGALSLPSTLSGTLNAVASYSCVRELTFPEGVTILTGQTGRECGALTKVVLPSTLTQIDTWCFYSVPSLVTIVCRATTPPTIGNSQVFANASGNADFAIWVPQGTISAYEAATNWSQFAGKFHELDANGNIPQA